MTVVGTVPQTLSRPAIPVERRLFLLATPALCFLAVLLFWPLLDLLKLSAASGTFAPYGKAIGEPLYAMVIMISFRIAALSALLCLLLAYPVSYFLATTTPTAAMIGFLFVMLPFWTSLLMRTYAWMVLLGRNGVINRTLLDLGLIEQPWPLMYNMTGVLIGTVHYLLPFMVFPIYASMKRIEPNIVLAAEGMGAGAWSILTRIYLPLTLNGILAGVALVFIVALSAFVTPALLGGGRVIMIANLIQTQVSQFLNWPLAAALSAIIVVATIAVYAALGLLPTKAFDGR